MSTPAMSSIDIEITLRTLVKRIEVMREATSRMGTFMNPLPTIGEQDWETLTFNQTSANQSRELVAPFALLRP